FSPLPLPPSLTLCPYTTLFRSLLDVGELLQSDAAVVAVGHFPHVVLKAPQGGHLVVGHDDAVPHHAHLGVAGELAADDVAANDHAHVGNLVGLPALGLAQSHLAELGGQHALHGAFNLLDAVVDDAVQPHVHAVPLGVLLGHGVGPHVKAHDNGVGGVGQHDVAFADCAHRPVDDVHPHLVVGELLQGLAHGLHRALHVGLDDDF